MPRGFSSSTKAITVLAVMTSSFLWGCDDATAPGGGNPPPGDSLTTYEPLVLSASMVGEFKVIPKFGDLWSSTWASDDNLYVAWGDGTGLGPRYPALASDPFADSCLVIDECGAPEAFLFCELFCSAFGCDGVNCYPPAILTAAGLFRLEGAVDAFIDCQEQCQMSIHVPTGIPLFEYGVDPGTRRNDKPSSLLFRDGTLYWSGHEPSGEAVRGYIAFSEDFGATWSESPDSPWTSPSDFRVLMFVNMGQGYALNEDGYVYGLGIGEEMPSILQNQLVHLARVSEDSIAVYEAYSYFTGVDESGKPRWSRNQYTSAPLEDLVTVTTGAAMYHPGIERFLFLALPEDGAGPALTVYEAPHPWGPWFKAQTFPGHIYIPGIIAKDTGPSSFYFTAAGGSVSYQMHIGRIEMEIDAP